MEPLLVYVLKSLVVSGVLTLWYLVGLRGKLLHTYNRFFLLSILALSLILPLVRFHLFALPKTVTYRVAPAAWVVQAEGSPVNSKPAASIPPVLQIDWLAVTFTITVGVSLVLLGILIARILWVIKLFKQNAIVEFEGAKLVYTDSSQAPFTFLNIIFWNGSISFQDKVGRLIFRHELAHVKQKHTYDKLFSQILTCLFWFNPFYWIVQRELSLVHEFIADAYAVEDRDTDAFARMLLHASGMGNRLAPQHFFFSSPVRRRLNMLQHTASPAYAFLLRFTAIPLVVCIILMFSINTGTARTKDIIPAKEPIVVVLDAGAYCRSPELGADLYSTDELCLDYAQRIQALSAPYNVKVHIIGSHSSVHNPAESVATANKISPHLYIALHTTRKTANKPEDEDLDIFIAGQRPYIAKSTQYSQAVLQALAEEGIVSGNSRVPKQVHALGCNCSNCLWHTALQSQKTKKLLSTERERLFVLNHLQSPGMAIAISYENKAASMQDPVSGTGQMDDICHSVLAGIVEGAKAKEDPFSHPFGIVSSTSDPYTCH